MFSQHKILRQNAQTSHILTITPKVDRTVTGANTALFNPCWKTNPASAGFFLPGSTLPQGPQSKQERAPVHPLGISDARAQTHKGSPYEGKQSVLKPSAMGCSAYRQQQQHSYAIRRN